MITYTYTKLTKNRLSWTCDYSAGMPSRTFVGSAEIKVCENV